jgi:hypothetical protein
MEKEGKGVAWICIFSTLLMGCYTSEVIEPKELENGRIAFEDLEYVVTQDSSRYDFQVPPRIHERALVGYAVPGLSFCPGGQKVSIPVSEILQTGMNTSGSIDYLVLKNKKRYSFDQPPAVADKCVVGVAKVSGPGGPPATEVSILLADIVYLGVSEPDAALTVAAVLGIIVVGGVLVLGVTMGGYGGPLMR